MTRQPYAGRRAGRGVRHHLRVTARRVARRRAPRSGPRVGRRGGRASVEIYADGRPRESAAAVGGHGEEVKIDALAVLEGVAPAVADATTAQVGAGEAEQRDEPAAVIGAPPAEDSATDAVAAATERGRNRQADARSGWQTAHRVPHQLTRARIRYAGHRWARVGLPRRQHGNRARAYGGGKAATAAPSPCGRAHRRGSRPRARRSSTIPRATAVPMRSVRARMASSVPPAPNSMSTRASAFVR